jgi:cell pole-organizing protein PopZ
MSASQTPPPSGSPPAATPAGGDPSMEDILASIRRILSEDEAQPGEAKPAAVTSETTHEAPSAHAEPAGDGVLVLDPSMMVTEPAAAAAIVQTPEPEPLPPTVVVPAPLPSSPTMDRQGLVAPEAAAAAVASVGALVRTLTAERSMQVHTGGPTIEDIVREELRPLLKEWLDTNLPPLVERLVRVEIERVVGRAVP